MKITYLREFIVLSQYLNFSLAAKYLHMTQPGLSRHISTLEEEVGVKLFTRDTHQVKLTESGRHFLIGVQKIVDDYDFLCESVAKIGLEKITIGVPYFGVDRYIGHIVNSFESIYPSVKINYLPSYPDEIIKALLNMQADVAVLPEVNFIHSEKLVFHHVFDEPLILMLNQNHPLSGKTEVRLSDLGHENFITVKGIFGDALFDVFCNFCRQRGFVVPRKATEMNTIESAALSMKPDSGVMLLPEHIKEANISGNIKFIEIIDKDHYLSVSLVHHADNNNPMTEKFIRHYLKNKN